MLRSEQCLEEVGPVGVRLFVNAQFPESFPLFHLHFAPSGFLQIIKGFEPDERFAPVPLREAVNDPLPNVPRPAFSGHL
jgi:hypothetical protein